ncbi:hypothetical protein PV08_04729 [Exophiala spinifera]|uniref:DUF3074 domain-containing protein n=1 Tax=Exophiala spinifera TaxID=91928 RepID=A0A0D2BG24_9EURO|nr:uncharacterized protein PV08_04729 [Exophiala spinifera]KIW17535.1 hypothetical protein PV08_04729 [Exophiala spinifera]
MAGESSSSNSGSSSPSNLIRLAPLQASDLPCHPDLPGSSAELLPFLTALLEDGVSFLSPSSFQAKFKHQSTKMSPPSAAKVDILTHSIPASSIAQVKWTRPSSAQNHSGGGGGGGGGAAISRSKPEKAEGEHWFARRSVHADVSSKSEEKVGHASWDEFVFGIRDEHSKHEMEFTPPLYDARKVVDWAGQINKLDGEGRLHDKFRNPTMGVYEMCHALPAPLTPRCFCVLVVTASKGPGGGGEDEEIVAVTVPVDLASANRHPDAAKNKKKKVGFYSSMRNLSEGEDTQKKKIVVMGAYTAVEVVRRHRDTEEIEWIMATASDARGNLPMWVQKLGVPGAIAKDVGFFLKWIKDVDESEILKSAA